MICISLLLEFVTKTESEAKTLPRSFKVLYLQVFGSGDPAGMSLCPVRILKSIYQKLRNSVCFCVHFLSPRNSPHPLLKNAISYFWREGSWFITAHSANKVAGTLQDSHVVQALCP